MPELISFLMFTGCVTAVLGIGIIIGRGKWCDNCEGKGEKMTKYLIMDGRANYNKDEAIVMEVCDTRKEAEKNKWGYGEDCVIVECEDAHRKEVKKEEKFEGYECKICKVKKIMFWIEHLRGKRHRKLAGWE